MSVPPLTGGESARGVTAPSAAAILLSAAVAGIVTESPGGALLAGVAALALGVCGYAMASGMQASGESVDSPTVWARRGATVGAVATAGLLTLGILTGSSALAFGVGLAVAVAAVVVRRRRRNAAAGRRTAGEPQRTAPAVPAEPVLPLEAMTDEQLCYEWRLSFRRLAAAAGPAQLDRVCEQRRRFLEELERRDSEGFRRWLASGARAASDPHPFLKHRSEPGRSEQG